MHKVPETFYILYAFSWMVIEMCEKMKHLDVFLLCCYNLKKSIQSGNIWAAKMWWRVSLPASRGWPQSNCYYRCNLLCITSVHICMNHFDWHVSPWRFLRYTFMFGISLKMIFLLMIANSVLCLIVAHLSCHGSQSAFSFLVVMQTIGKFCNFRYFVESQTSH